MPFVRKSLEVIFGSFERKNTSVAAIVVSNQEVMELIEKAVNPHEVDYYSDDVRSRGALGILWTATILNLGIEDKLFMVLFADDGSSLKVNLIR
jgi:hypothetical protein